MFGPRHTIESVAKELIDGFDEGSIILRAEEPTGADVERFESMMQDQLARNRRKETLLLIASSVAMIAGVAANLMEILSYPEGGIRSPGLDRWKIALLLTSACAVAGFFSAFMARGRSIELKTYLRILKIADSDASKRLVMRVASKFRERELVPRGD